MIIELQGKSIYRRAYPVKKSIFEQIGGTYYRQGDYILPNIAVPESVPIGVWGQRHLRAPPSHLYRHAVIRRVEQLSG